MSEAVATLPSLCSLLPLYMLCPPDVVLVTLHLKSMCSYFIDVGTERSVPTPPAWAWQDSLNFWHEAACWTAGCGAVADSG